MKALKISKALAFSIIGILIFNIFLRWNSFTMPFERDEGEYAYSAWILRQGLTPYKDSFLQKPPLIIYTYLFGQIIDENSLWPPRVLATIFALAATLLLAIIVSKEFGEKIGIISAWLLTPMLTFPYFMGVTANTEIFMLLPLLGVIGCFIWGKEKKSTWYWFWAGVFSSLAILYKPICLYVICFIFIIWLIWLWKIKKDVFILIRNFLYMVIGGVGTSGLVMLPLILKGGWPYFVETAIIFNSYYIKMRGFGLGNLIPQLVVISKNWWILALPVVCFFIKRPKDWWFYLGLLATSILGVYQSPIGHYYLIIMPFLAIIASIGVSNLALYFKNRPLVLITAIVLVFMILPIRGQFGMTPKDLNIWIYGTANPFSEAEEVAQHLAEITEPRDLVFVAGSEPEILFYSKRKSVSRFVITHSFIMDTPLRTTYQKEAINDLTVNTPSALVFSKRKFSSLWNEESPRYFIDYLTDKIDKDYKLVGGYVWDKNGGYWLSTISKEDIELASLLLYKKI